jgi:hypothetical protein
MRVCGKFAFATREVVSIMRVLLCTRVTVCAFVRVRGLRPRAYDWRRAREEKQEQRSFFFWHKPEMRAALRTTMRRLGLQAAAAKLLGGATAKNEMPAVSEKSCGGLPPMPMARKPWFRKPHR